MTNPFVYLSYSFGVKTLISTLTAGIVCSLVGTFIVLRKMTFIGAGISHVAFAGVALSLMFNLPPLLGAFAFSLIASVTVWYLERKYNIHHDVAIGILFAGSMGLAVAILSISGNYGSKVLSFLFGSPLTAESGELVFLVITALISLVFFSAFWKEIFLISFSEEIALASGIDADKITFFLFLLVSLAITTSIKTVGAVLVFSLLVVPPATALKITKGYKSFVAASVATGMLSSVLGVLISFSFDIPTGAGITLSSIAIFLAGLTFHKIFTQEER